MASSSHTAAPVNPSRRPSHRLFFVLACAVILVTLPVLPFHLMGLGPEFAPDLSGFARISLDALGKINPDFLNLLPAENKETNEKTLVTSDVQVMDNAAKHLLNAITKSPEDPALRNELGLLYAGLGEYTNAVAQLEKAVDLSRTQLNALASKEEQLRAQGKGAEASQALLQRSRLSVQLSASHSTLARVFDQLGQHDRVVAQLEQLNKDICFGSAFSAGLRKETHTAARLAPAARRLSPQVLLFLARADAFMQSGRYVEAIQEYRHVINVDPLVVSAHQKLGHAAALTGNYGLAVQALETAVRLEPTNSKNHVNLGLAYQALHETAKAKSSLEQALKINDKDADAAYNLGNMCAQSGEMEAAAQYLTQAAKLSPQAPMVHNNLGTVLSLNGNYQQAVAEFQQALALAPDLASSHYGLGLALYNCKEYPASIREFKHALALNPGLTDVHNKIEQAYRKAGLATSSSIPVN